MALGSGGWQTSVGTVPTPGFPGDRASANPFVYYAAGPGGLVAGASGVTVGRFAWVSYQGIDPDNAPTVANNFAGQLAGVPQGFVPREFQGLNTTYLSDAGVTVPRGFGVSLVTRGDLWVKNDGSTTALFGMKAYAKFSDGSVSFRPAATPTSATINGSIAAATGIVTGTVAGNVLTATAVTGTIVAGALVYGTVSGSGVIAGTRVVSQLSGTAGTTGTYALSIGEQAVLVSGTLQMTYGILTVGTVSAGTLSAGDILSGGTVTAGTEITQFASGTGGTGTYYVDPSQTTTAAGLSATTDVETSFVAISSGLAGEVVKMSVWAGGV